MLGLVSVLVLVLRGVGVERGWCWLLGLMLRGVGVGCWGWCWCLG